jgi:hypothetical protein
MNFETSKMTESSKYDVSTHRSDATINARPNKLTMKRLEKLIFAVSIATEAL